MNKILQFALGAAAFTMLLGLIPSHGLCQQDQAASGSRGYAIRRDAAFQQIVKARTRLEAYDAVLERYRKTAKPDLRYSGLNYERHEVLTAAIEAYRFAGAQKYPQGGFQLSNMIDSLPDTAFEQMLCPTRLEDLVACGILPHLPASPYPTGAYLDQLPDQAQPGDICYMPIPIYETNLNPKAGSFEGELLLIFDKAYEGNPGLLDAAGLQECCHGIDYTKYFSADKYNNIIYVLLNDRDEQAKADAEASAAQGG